MKPSLERLIDEMEKISSEQEDLHKEIVSLRGSELLQLREEVSRLKMRFWQAAAVYATVAIVCSGFGIFVWFKQLPDKLNTIVDEDLPARIEKALPDAIHTCVTPEIDKMMETARQEMRDVVYAGCDFEKALNEFNKGTMKLYELGKLAKNRRQNEIVVFYYSDILLQKEQYPSAFDFLAYLKDEGLFPKKYKRSEVYTNAGCIQWIHALRPESKRSREALVAEARGYLERAVEEAEGTYIKENIRRPVAWMIFVHLFQNEKLQALEKAVRFKDLGGNRSSLVTLTQSDWFKNMVGAKPESGKALAEILMKVFPDSRSAAESQ